MFSLFKDLEYIHISKWLVGGWSVASPQQLLEEIYNWKKKYKISFLTVIIDLIFFVAMFF